MEQKKRNEEKEFVGGRKKRERAERKAVVASFLFNFSRYIFLGGLVVKNVWAVAFHVWRLDNLLNFSQAVKELEKVRGWESERVYMHIFPSTRTRRSFRNFQLMSVYVCEYLRCVHKFKDGESVENKVVRVCNTDVDPLVFSPFSFT